MKADTLPPWQSSSSQTSETERYALIELAHLPVAARTTLFNELAKDSHYWPLIKDESQPHLQREGPWVLQVRCRVPDDQMSYRSYPLLAARELLQQFIQEQAYGHQTA